MSKSETKNGFIRHHSKLFNGGKKSGAGFTLIELLVVIAVIGLLASIILIAMNSARVKARDSVRKANVAQLRTALELYANSNQENYPNGSATANANCNNGNGNGNGKGNCNNNGNGNGNNVQNSACTSVGTQNTESDIQCLTNFLVPAFIGSVPNDPSYASGGKNFEYVWKNGASGNPTEYGILIPFSNEGEQDCQVQTTGGSPSWFNGAPICSY